MGCGLGLIKRGDDNGFDLTEVVPIWTISEFNILFPVLDNG